LYLSLDFLFDICLVLLLSLLVYFHFVDELFC
jgi:hypothetical protein